MTNTFLIALYIACDLTANITASKPIDFFGLVAPGGVYIYAITFTLIDLINEQLEKTGARHVIYAAFATNILLALYSSLVVALPSPPFYTNQTAFASVLGATPRIVAASLIAYVISSLIDVEIFSWWKERVGHRKWARVLVSNAVSTLVDSVVFVAIAFIGALPILPLLIGQYVMKMGITVTSIPLIYLVHDKSSTKRL